MTKTMLLRRASRRLKGLSEERLRLADGFLAYLEEEDATEELLRIPGFAEEFEEAERDIAAGRLTPAEKLRRKF
ncbi:MAG: hypothetical protein FJ290_29530 [Planctomycetes bacterium]|nr:hypothetical protein [Planctomycetota bacterium]